MQLAVAIQRQSYGGTGNKTWGFGWGKIKNNKKTTLQRCEITSGTP